MELQFSRKPKKMKLDQIILVGPRDNLRQHWVNTLDTLGMRNLRNLQGFISVYLASKFFLFSVFILTSRHLH